VAQNGFHVGDTSTSTKTLLRKDDVPLEPHKNIALDNTSSSTHAVASLTATEKNNIPDAKTENAVTTVRKKVASTTINLPKPIVHVSRTTTSVATGTTNLLDEGLHEDEVIALSNSERVRAGLAPLTKNSHLHAMAEAKAVDMINKQYFDHVSPLGVTIGILADTYGYKYIHIGENLALGDFASSSHVVDGWMNSPGHRANILGKDYTEIGVSVLRGSWEGREVWWAVQEFGKPFPNCESPNESMKQQIESSETQLDQLRKTLDTLKLQIDQTDRSKGEYQQRVHDYNLQVDKWNVLLASIKSLVAQYNGEVNSYNACISE
jgi:uncharacterized protein YkwD